MPPAPESQGLGRDETKGVPVPPAPEPYATRHAFEFELATLGLGGTPLVPQDAAPTWNGGSAVAAHSTSVAASGRPLFVCQSPIGEGIGKPWVPNTNPQWKRIVNREQKARAPVTREPAMDTDVRPAESRQLLLVTWWLNEKCPHWWVALWCLLLGAMWPTASYVLTGCDCANPTHVAAYNKDKMCDKDPLHLGHEFHFLQHVKIREGTGYSYQLKVTLPGHKSTPCQVKPSL